MNTEEYRKQFEQVCFRPALEEMLREVNKRLSKGSGQVRPLFIRPLAGFLEELTKEDVHYVSLSFLRVSMCQKKSVILAEGYTEIPFLSQPELSREIPAEVLFPGWEIYQKEIEERLKKELFSHYIRRPEQKSYESLAVSTLLRFLYFYIRYAIRGVEDETVWSTLLQKQEFTISFGEYMDWQLPVLAVKPKIDIFLCDAGENLTFRRFYKTYYEEKKFDNWILDDCVFEKCTFEHVIFQGTYLRNVRFIECIFRDCQFQDVKLMGASMLNSSFYHIDFSGCCLLEGWQKENGGMFYYTAGEFKWCVLNQVCFLQTETDNTMYQECQMQDIRKE